jgi:hypothetical protein
VASVVNQKKIVLMEAWLWDKRLFGATTIIFREIAEETLLKRVEQTSTKGYNDAT